MRPLSGCQREGVKPKPNARSCRAVTRRLGGNMLARGRRLRPAYGRPARTSIHRSISCDHLNQRQITNAAELAEDVEVYVRLFNTIRPHTSLGQRRPRGVNCGVAPTPEVSYLGRLTRYTCSPSFLTRDGTRSSGSRSPGRPSIGNHSDKIAIAPLNRTFLGSHSADVHVNPPSAVRSTAASRATIQPVF